MKGRGDDYYLWIESSTPGTYNYVKGQQDASVKRSGGAIGTTTKDDAGWETSLPGNRSWSVSLGALPNLPDANGYTRLETQCAGRVVFNVQLRKGGVTGGSSDVVFAGACHGIIDDTSFRQNAEVPVSISLTGTGAPTTDVLAI